MTITSDRLLEGVKRRVSSPASQVLMTNTDILAIADDIISSYLVPLFVSVRQDYFVTSSETALEANEAEYSIPYRALARGLRDLKMIDESGTVRDMALIPIEDAHIFSNAGTPHSFYFKGDKVVITPTPTAAGSSLQFWWEDPPGRLVTVSSAALVSGISDDTINVSSVPSTMTAGVEIDFIKGKSGNATISIDKEISSVSGTQILFSSGDVPDDLAVGDYISLAGTSPVIQLPGQAYPLLESRVSKQFLISVGDFDGAKQLDEAISSQEKNLKIMVEPRIQGEPTVILARRGLLRGRRFMNRRGFFGGI